MEWAAINRRAGSGKLPLIFLLFDSFKRHRRPDFTVFLCFLKAAPKGKHSQNTGALGHLGNNKRAARVQVALVLAFARSAVCVSVPTSAS